MISQAELNAGLTGAWRLARRDRGGMACFDLSPHGFWMSFWALALAAPADILLDGLSGAFAGPRGVAAGLTIQVIAAIVDAVAFPLVMAGVAERMGRGDHYIRFIVANNWAALLRMGLLFPVALLAQFNPAFAAAMAGMMIVLMVYEAYIAHVALEIGIAAAAGIVVLDLMLDTIVAIVSKAMLGT